MAPCHHPDLQVLADLVFGDCSPGTALLVSRHVALCSHCRRKLADMGTAEPLRAHPEAREWSTIADQVEAAPLHGAAGLGEEVYELRAERSAAFSLAGPLRVAEVLVLEGALQVAGASFAPGDYLAVGEAADAAVPKTCARFVGWITVTAAEQSAELS